MTVDGPNGNYELSEQNSINPHEAHITHFDVIGVLTGRC